MTLELPKDLVLKDSKDNLSLNEKSFDKMFDNAINGLSNKDKLLNKKESIKYDINNMISTLNLTIKYPRKDGFFGVKSEIVNIVKKTGNVITPSVGEKFSEITRDILGDSIGDMISSLKTRIGEYLKSELNADDKLAKNVPDDIGPIATKLANYTEGKGGMPLDKLLSLFYGKKTSNSELQPKKVVDAMNQLNKTK